jgi:CPA1 family monovalent cation:H+ antiporter
LNLFNIIAVLIALTALFSYFNHRFLQLHPTTGVMLISLALSVLLIILAQFGWASGLHATARQFMAQIRFGDALLHWMLGFFLFAGALTVDINELSRQRGLTAALAIAATVASMFIAAGLLWLILRSLGIGMDWIHCLLFGALISPTDPVAVLSLVTRVGAPRDMQTIIAGESLLNDGVGVVLFLTLLDISQHHLGITALGVARLFFQQSAGGAILGAVAGFLVHRLLIRTYDFQVSVLLTLALVMGGYALADAMHVSGPIAMVVAGLFIGRHGRVGIRQEVSLDLMKFWIVLDEILNALLFVLIGLEVLEMPFSKRYLFAGAAAIPAILLARWLTVVATVRSMHFGRQISRGLEAILTWGGLRGGLALAMALSLPGSDAHDRIIAITYIVVAFSILVQGTTIRRVVEWAMVPETAG